jgi:hypothetical protein
VIVMGMLVVVLAVTYKMLVDCLEADRTIDKLTVPEKIGEGILSLLRSDLSGTLYRGLGRRVFVVTDVGLPPDARDEIRFLTTVEPTPHEEASSSTVAVTQERAITGIAYFLRQSQLEDNVLAFTLFRKEMVDLNPETPLESRGINYEVYDKVKYLSIECYDGYGWFPDWNSEARIQLEAQDLAQSSQANQKEIGRVSDPQKKPSFKTPPPSPSAARNAPGVDPGASPVTPVLPPAGIPVAVRVEIGVYVGSGIGAKLDRDAQGSPVVKTFSTIIPILAAQRVAIQLEDEDLGGGGGASTSGGAEAGGGGGGGGGAATPGGGGGGGAGQPTKRRQTSAGGGTTRPGGAGAPGGRGSGSPAVPKAGKK